MSDEKQQFLTDTENNKFRFINTKQIRIQNERKKFQLQPEKRLRIEENEYSKYQYLSVLGSLAHNNETRHSNRNNQFRSGPRQRTANCPETNESESVRILMNCRKYLLSSLLLTAGHPQDIRFRWTQATGRNHSVEVQRNDLMPQQGSSMLAFMIHIQSIHVLPTKFSGHPLAKDGKESNLGRKRLDRYHIIKRTFVQHLCFTVIILFRNTETDGLESCFKTTISMILTGGDLTMNNLAKIIKNKLIFQKYQFFPLS